MVSSTARCLIWPGCLPPVARSRSAGPSLLGRCLTSQDGEHQRGSPLSSPALHFLGKFADQVVTHSATSWTPCGGVRWLQVLRGQYSPSREVNTSIWCAATSRFTSHPLAELGLANAPGGTGELPQQTGRTRPRRGGTGELPQMGRMRPRGRGRAAGVRLHRRPPHAQEGLAGPQAGHPAGGGPPIIRGRHHHHFAPALGRRRRAVGDRLRPAAGAPGRGPRLGFGIAGRRALKFGGSRDGNRLLVLSFLGSPARA